MNQVQFPSGATYERYALWISADLSHNLSELDLASKVVKVRAGAVPLFHSLVSSERIEDREFRVGELAAAVPAVSHELSAAFGKKEPFALLMAQRHCTMAWV